MCNHIVYKCADDGFPRVPLVFVHGFMQEGCEWDPIVVRLGPMIACAAPTLAPQRGADASLSALASRVVAAADSLLRDCGGDSYALVGYSMGGRVALEVARRDSGRVGALILESAGLGPENEAQRCAMREKNATMANRLRKEGLEQFVAWWEQLGLFASQRDLPDDVRERVRAARLRCDARALALLLEHAGAHTMPLASQTRRWLSEAKFPVLYAAGARDAKYTALGESLPSPVRFESFDGCGHNVHLENPDGFADCLKSFLQFG